VEERMQQETVYIKIPKEIKVSHTDVVLKDIGCLYCKDKELEKKLEKLLILRLEEERKEEKYMVSFLCVVEGILSVSPGISIENMGETDFVVVYNGNDTKDGALCHILEWGKTAVVCLILFFGAAFTIMAFNTDVAVDELFDKLYFLVMGTKGDGRSVLELSYCIGLPVGIITFFDHFKPAVRRQDPTPMEVQMRTYEEDVNNVLIQNAAREGRTIEKLSINSKGRRK
jgi:stage V sporulation protein AA